MVAVEGAVVRVSVVVPALMAQNLDAAGAALQVCCVVLACCKAGGVGKVHAATGFHHRAVLHYTVPGS